MIKLNLELNKENLVSLYYENKEFVFPALSIFVSIILFFVFLLPQILSFPSRKSEIDKEVEKLNKIKQAIEMNQLIDQVALDSEVRIVSQALPSNKAFENILNAISQAANLSNTQIISYQFQESGSGGTQVQSIPALSFEVNIIGGLTQVAPFIDQLYKTYPISGVIDIKNSEGISTISIAFYYKAFPQFGTDHIEKIGQLGDKEQKVLEEISNWSSPEVQSLTGIIPATASGEARSSPFD